MGSKNKKGTPPPAAQQLFHHLPDGRKLSYEVQEIKVELPSSSSMAPTEDDDDNKTNNTAAAAALPGKEEYQEAHIMDVLLLHGMGFGGRKGFPRGSEALVDVANAMSNTILQQQQNDNAAAAADSDSDRVDSSSSSNKLLVVRMISVDRPGYGDSSPPPFAYSYKRFAKDMESFLQELGIITATVVSKTTTTTKEEEVVVVVSSKEQQQEGPPPPPKNPERQNRSNHSKKLFFVVGQSSGGPNALALAYFLKKKRENEGEGNNNNSSSNNAHVTMVPAVDGVAFTSGDPPYVHADCPEILRKCQLESDLNNGKHGSSPYGQDLLEYAEKYKKPIAMGYVNDYTLERIPWSFPCEEIDLRLKIPITIWVGENDFEVMKHGADFLHNKLLPHCSKKNVVPNEGHYYCKKPKILGQILGEIYVRATCSSD